MTAKLISESKQRVAFFAGSFNPFTVGHASVVERALPLFDHIIIAIGLNVAKHHADADKLQDSIAALYADEPRVQVMTYDGLTANVALDCGATCLLRGVRSVKDFEYERDMAEVNRKLSGLETLLIYTLPEHAAISSSLVRELSSYGADVSQFLPQPK